MLSWDAGLLTEGATLFAAGCLGVTAAEGCLGVDKPCLSNHVRDKTDRKTVFGPVFGLQVAVRAIGLSREGVSYQPLWALQSWAYRCPCLTGWVSFVTRSRPQEIAQLVQVRGPQNRARPGGNGFLVSSLGLGDVPGNR